MTNLIARRYEDDVQTQQRLLANIQLGGSGSWGDTKMNAHPQLSRKEIRAMLSYIFTLKPENPF